MLGYIAAVERLGAAFLLRIGSILQLVGKTMETTPLSSLCARFLSYVIPVEDWSQLSGFSLILMSGLLALAFVLTLTSVFRYAYLGPCLSTVPPPAAIYDPDVDVQSDQFGDEDVRPQLVSSSIRPSIHAVNPATGTSLGYIAAHTPSDMGDLVAKVRTAQRSWSTSSFTRRRNVLRAILDYIVYEQRELCAISSRDTGKTPVEANLGEIIPTLEKLRWLISEGESALRPSKRSVGLMTLHKVAIVQYVPLGVIAAIAPWNYPLHNIVNPVSAALFAGCGIVVKPSEHAIFSSVHFIRIIRRALAICKENPELVQCAVGGPDVAAELVKTPVDKVFFTGSTAIGRKVALAAAESLTPTCLELGGKDAFIVCDDADFNHTMSICLRGVFQNAGQNCIGVERVFVHSRIKQRFIDLAVEKVAQLRPGVDMGAMTMGGEAIQRIQAFVDDAISSGAKLLAGGKQAELRGKGWFYAPTVLTNVTSDMKIAREEVFGPVMSVIDWENEDELIEKVNNSPFGLGSSIFTENKTRGERILKQLRVGMGNINDYATNYLCQSMPFGGTKESGYGRFAGIEGLRGCCLVQATTRDRFPGIKTSIPKALQYPIGVNAMELTSEINDFLFGRGMTSKIDNVRNLLGMLLFPSWRPRSVGSG